MITIPVDFGNRNVRDEVFLSSNGQTVLETHPNLNHNVYFWFSDSTIRIPGFIRRYVDDVSHKDRYVACPVWVLKEFLSEEDRPKNLSKKTKEVLEIVLENDSGILSYVHLFKYMEDILSRKMVYYLRSQAALAEQEPELASVFLSESKVLSDFYRNMAEVRDSL
jgi:hypothetical protein